MPVPHLALSGGEALAAGFAAIRSEHEVDDAMPAAVEAAAAAAAAASPAGFDRADRRDVALRTLDPLGSRDLDQAFHLSRDGDGFVLRYAIADVASWVQPGDVVDAEAWRRGCTVYCPDLRAPLHPTSLSEERASLLPDQDAPAVLWTLRLDAAGRTVDTHVERATVRSRGALDYAGLQAWFDSGAPTDAGHDDSVALLREVGEALIAAEAARGGVSLTLPTQVVERRDDRFVLRYDTALQTEAWNAQLSLCCGAAAAQLMLHAGVGLLRTLPPAQPADLAELREASGSLGVAWPDGTSYPEWVRSLDPTTPEGTALMVAASRTLRGAGYAAFDGEVPERHEHSALAMAYAHVTAPLRRLGDRVATECALAAAAGRRPPGWAIDALASVPAAMDAANQRASSVHRACIDLTEVAVLAPLVGQEFEGTVTVVDERGRATVQLRDPAVIASAELPAGTRDGSVVRVRLDSVDLPRRQTRFVAAKRPFSGRITATEADGGVTASVDRPAPRPISPHAPPQAPPQAPPHTPHDETP